MISHVRKSKHIFIDCTWYQPQGLKQILVILFKDIIINKKIPCCFMILKNKRYEIYEKCLNSFKNIITQNNIFDLEIETITTDAETALLNAINNIFPNIMHFNCYYHYKVNILTNVKKYGLLNKNNNETNIKDIKKVIYQLGQLPILYNGDISVFYNNLNYINNQFPYTKEFIDNYFEKNFKKYFIDLLGYIP